jgi:hypothetical protein
MAVGLVGPQKTLGDGVAAAALGNQDAVLWGRCHEYPEKYN